MSVTTSPAGPQITQAMREHCRRLATPGALLTRSSLVMGYRITGTPLGGVRMTYVMGMRLEDAGLVQFAGNVGTLTDKGREVAR